MSAIIVENLSKRYVIEHESQHDTLRDTLQHTARKLWRRWRWGTGFAREEFWALRDVSFQVEPGEVVGIIGRNGAGKSTLLKILSRITEATTGRVRLRGRVASLLEVGTGFHPELTGRENIFLNGAILGMSRAEIRRKFDEIVAFSEVERFLDTPVKRYSSGMYVRLAFAVAAHLEPEILIVDEVLAVGDVAFQKKCLGKMRRVASDDGRTVLFVSHNLAAVQQLCGSAVLLSQGRLAARGSVASVLRHYHSGAETGPVSIQAPTELLDRAYVTAAALETAEGRPVANVPIGAAWRLRVSFTLARRMDAFVAALGIVAVDGTPVQTAWGRAEALAPGNYEATFTQNSVRLAAGAYDLLAGLNEANQTIQQILVGRLEIEPATESSVFPVSSGAGLVMNSMEFSLART